MNLISIISFLMAALISYVLFLVTFIMVHIFIFGLFDTTANLSEFESQEYKQLILQFLITVCFIIGVIIVLGYDKKFRFFGSILPWLFILTISVFDYANYYPLKEFDKKNWKSSGEKQFLEARSIVLGNSFNGKTREEILTDLGEPKNNKTQSILSYDIENTFTWTLSIYFDTCCVIKTELTKEPWNL